MSDFSEVLIKAREGGILLDSCGLAERSYDFGTYIDLCGMSPKDYMSTTPYPAVCCKGGGEGGGGKDSGDTATTTNTITFYFEKDENNVYTLTANVEKELDSDVDVTLEVNGEKVSFKMPKKTVGKFTTENTYTELPLIVDNATFETSSEAYEFEPEYEDVKVDEYKMYFGFQRAKYASYDPETLKAMDTFTFTKEEPTYTVPENSIPWADEYDQAYDEWVNSEGEPDFDPEGYIAIDEEYEGIFVLTMPKSIYDTTSYSIIDVLGIEFQFDLVSDDITIDGEKYVVITNSGAYTSENGIITINVKFD